MMVSAFLGEVYFHLVTQFGGSLVLLCEFLPFVLCYMSFQGPFISILYPFHLNKPRTFCRGKSCISSDLG